MAEAEEKAGYSGTSQEMTDILLVAAQLVLVLMSEQPE